MNNSDTNTISDIHDIRRQQELLLERDSTPKINEIYRHYKGKYYIIYGVGMNESDHTYEVIYNDVMEPMPLPYHRPLSEFKSSVITNEESISIPRFSFVRMAIDERLVVNQYFQRIY
jgi:hypothetical protein